jgi:hypothetical protein
LNFEAAKPRELQSGENPDLFVSGGLVWLNFALILQDFIARLAFFANSARAQL